jgi:tRNA-dihydrouridine synthase A
VIAAGTADGAATTAVRGVTRHLSFAPMMDHTDRHCRFVLRQLTRATLLYTEMINANALVLGRRIDLLRFSPAEHPVALQLGGDDPTTIAAAARIAVDHGYDEINLNVGCPSDRVQKGRFGACLMAEPERVADMVAATRAVVGVPVTVKHRIGIDERDSYEELLAFVDTVARAGCDRFIVHARKAWLHGLSPKENRTVPPLRYGDVHRLKRERPDLRIEINGGFVTQKAVLGQLGLVDGVMVGRAALDDPWMWSTADREIFGVPSDPVTTRPSLVAALVPYLEATLDEGLKLHLVLRHLLGLFRGTPGARRWKHGVAELARRADRAAIAEVVALARDLSESAGRGPPACEHPGS